MTVTIWSSLAASAHAWRSGELSPVVGPPGPGDGRDNPGQTGLSGVREWFLDVVPVGSNRQ
jgi:hypothetical protein